MSELTSLMMNKTILNYTICKVYSPNFVSSGSTKISDYKVTPNSCFAPPLSQLWITQSVILINETLLKQRTQEILQILFSLLCVRRVYFASWFRQKLWSWIYLQFCEYLLWVKANEMNYLAVSSLLVHRSEGRLS